MKILIVDDEQNIRNLMARYLLMSDIQSLCAENGFAAQRMLREEAFDACLVDLKMSQMNGLELISWIRAEGFRMPVIMMSAHGEINDAVTALKTGAQDYVIKPFDPEELTIKLKNLVEAQNLRNKQELSKRDNEVQFIGESPEIRKIKSLLSRISPTSSTVLVTGESGVGKEVIAKSIHAMSLVSDGPFVAINIGGIPENLLESELFGYEKGAFTGAVGRKTGMFEMASGGTLFLDEIGDMPLSLQVKLLRVLQEKTITRLGSTAVIPINARIICATNKNIENLVKQGSFRQDLFYRLNVVSLEIPPLRERKDDIPLLCHFVLKKFNSSMNRHLEGFTPSAMAVLKNYNYPGNVRELENIIERAVIFADGNLITENDLSIKARVVLEEDNDYSLRKIEKNAIIQSLKRWEGNRTKAADELGISRRTLITKIQEYNLGEEE